MITIRSGAWTREDLIFAYSVLRDGLEKNCFAFSENKAGMICNDCKQKTSCKELQSALHHILSIVYRKEAKS